MVLLDILVPPGDDLVDLLVGVAVGDFRRHHADSDSGHEPLHRLDLGGGRDVVAEGIGFLS